MNIREMTLFHPARPTYATFCEPQALPYDNPKKEHEYRSKECAYIQINHQKEKKRYTMKVS